MAWDDLTTKRSIAFYAFLSLAVLDAIKTGFTHWNVGALALMAGLGGLGLVRAALGKK